MGAFRTLVAISSRLFHSGNTCTQNLDGGHLLDHAYPSTPSR